MPSWPHNCTIHLADVPGPKECLPMQREGLCHYSSPYRWSTGIFDPFGDLLGRPCAPTPTWEHHSNLLGNKRPPLCLESIFSPCDTLDFIRPSQRSNDSSYSLVFPFCPFERPLFVLLSYLGGLVIKSCHYHVLFYYLGLIRPIRKIKSALELYKYDRSTF